MLPPISRAILVCVAGFVLPLILIPVIHITGYSEAVEELAGALVIWFLILGFPSRQTQFIVALMFGVLFGVSENFLYFSQIFQGGDLIFFWERFVLTVPMHVISSFIILIAATYRKPLIIVGLFGAIAFHLAFNTIVR